MSSTNPTARDSSADGEVSGRNGRDDGKKQKKHKFFKKHGRKRSEEAPLIANDALEETDNADMEADVSHVSNDEGAKKDNRSFTTLRNASQWIWDHLLVLCVLILLVTGVIALVVYFALFYNTESDDKHASICLTPSCVLAASSILENMSPDYHQLDPCIDFDRFVCDGFDERHDLRPDQGGIFTGTLMAERGEQILRHVLESPYSIEDGDFETHSSAKKDIFVKLKDAYDSCMDIDQIKEAGSRPLLSVLRNIESLFPVVHTQKFEDDFPQLQNDEQHGLLYEGSNQLSKTISYLNDIGVTAIIALGAGADDKDPDNIVVSVNAPRQPGLPSKQSYKDPQLLIEYGKVIGQVLESLLDEARRPNDTTKLAAQGGVVAQSARLVGQIIAFESQLAKLAPDTEDAEDVTFYYNPMTPEQLSALLPNISVSSIVSKHTSSGCKPEKYIVGSPHYLEGVTSLLRSTSAETLQAYFVWKTVQAYAYKADDDALKPLKMFDNKLQGKDPDATEERWRTCIKVVDNDLGWILSKFFVEQAFSKQAKDFGDRIILDIKAEFIKKLRVAEWMSEDVQNLGIEKVQNIVQKIGYPTKSPNIEDSSDVENYYESVTIHRDDYFGNAISAARFDTMREWSALCKPTNHDEWGMTADTVNAYYNPAGNEIVFPAGIMQDPVFYDPSLPQYLSYGSFGSVSGHELSHAFDSSGRHYDETGNFTDWWDEDTVEAFKDKVRCFIDQYHNFTVLDPNGKPLHVNGILTLGENLADAGGLSASYLAWKQRETKNPAQLLPGLQHFSKEQIFFISYASFWCGKTRPETAVQLIYRDPHAPKRARILGTLANSRGFREAFDCPKKEPTCELW